MHITLQLPVLFLREGKRFVAYTPALDISTSGKTFKEAQRRFAELASLFFEEIEQAGTRDVVLKNLGWKKEKRAWRVPVVVGQEAQTVRMSV